MSDELTSIRCPFIKEYTSKHTGKLVKKVCNKQCVKVQPGSRGEAYCSTCDKAFDFEVSFEDSGNNRLYNMGNRGLNIEGNSNEQVTG